MHQNKNQNKNQQHIPVLLEQVLHFLDPKEGESYLDLTAGYGGHAKAITDMTGSLTATVLVDRDHQAIEELKKIFPRGSVDLRQQDFLSASRELLAEEKRFDIILADLGVSSLHLNLSSRGFAIKTSGPLDMRMDQTQEKTAGTIINTYSQTNLEEILRRFGEEPKAKQIARAIIEARPLTNTAELAAIVQKAWPGHARIHPATRTFQAIRIAVNDELSLLENSLPLWLELLKPGGRIAVISFHSLEDRLVKQILSDASGDRFDATLKLLTKRPFTANQNEIAFNPRARSAKLRAAAKIKI